jgi:hypothetical protein
MSEKHVAANVSPNYSLRKFAETHLAEPGEWDEFLRVKDAAKPVSRPVWAPDEATPGQQYLSHVEEEPSPDFLLRSRLEQAFVERFRAELLSGKWSVKGIARGASNRAEIAPDLAAQMNSVSFLDDRLGGFTFVEIEPSSLETRYLRLKWMIEQICDVVPAKQRFGKEQVEALADRLLPFDVRNDVFKAAWAEAKIPAEYRKPGP